MKRRLSSKARQAGGADGWCAAVGQAAACDLCGLSDYERIGELDRLGNPLRTLVCRHCGLVSHADIPSDQELADYYRRDYREDYNNEFMPSSFRFVREWKRGRRRFEMLHPFLASSARVFEIGTGTGCNLKHFELGGFEVAGVEPGDGFRRFAQEKLQLRVEGCMLMDIPRVPRYDFILLVHVLEHMKSPTRALRHVRGLLQPGGRLYVEVPNFAGPHAAPGKLFHYAHIYNFTPVCLATAAGATGFVVDKVFSAPREKNLKVLLSATDSYTLRVVPGAYRHAVESVTRFNRLTYHLRWEYLRDRLVSLGRLLIGRVRSRKEVARILHMCDGGSGGRDCGQTVFNKAS
ncbi:MAG: class I SAM-dependent methyltransferase [Planctomycetota bacterium]